LKKRRDQGTYWWELRSCAYYDLFESPKLFHTDIAWRPQFSFSKNAVYLLNTAYVWPTDDLYLLAVVNSPVLWAYMWRNAVHGKDDALRLIYSFTKALPIAEPTDAMRTEAEERVSNIIEFTRENQQSQNTLLDWISLEMSILKPGNKLSDAATLEYSVFVSEIKKRRPKGSPKLGVGDVKRLKEAYTEIVPNMQRNNAEIFQHEHRLSELVNEAYGL
ncbi:MAG: class I SAM-dependent DNA methyltransferase, partial [Proteobacteria bacterium]|nr:class I SAM-dependent DNA methyltransferase [Pseudomonadota bacterium]